MRARPSDPISGPDARHAVLEQLRKAEYHRQDPSYLDRAWTWVLHRLDSLFSGSASGNALLVLLVILAAVVIFAVVRAGPPSRSAHRLRTVEGDPLRPSARTDHRRLALEFTAGGRRAEALREWLRAAVQTIEDRGVLPARPGRTGAATAREAGPLLPAAAGDLRSATAAFDEVWFGGREATDADVRLGQCAADSVLDARLAAPVAAGEFVAPR
ncbi:MAG: DUF4129 domain-containing protein [Jatrophihabitantaceae bacterium]